MAFFHEIGKRYPWLAAVIVIAALLIAAASASAATINAQTVYQRSRSDTYWRCSFYAQHAYPRIDFYSIGRCIHIHVDRPKYMLLSGRKMKADTEFVTMSIVGRTQMHCYQRLYWKGHDNDIRIYKRSRQSCTSFGSE